MKPRYNLQRNLLWKFAKILITNADSSSRLEKPNRPRWWYTKKKMLKNYFALLLIDQALFPAGITAEGLHKLLTFTEPATNLDSQNWDNVT